MKRNSITLLIGTLLVIIFALLLFTFQVRVTDVAVVATFGKTREVGPGPHLRLPAPFQRVYKMDRRIQTFEDKLTQDFTSDKITLLTSVYVGWKIADSTLFFSRTRGSTQEAERTLNDLVRNAKTATVGRHPLSDFISTTGGGAGFVAIESEMLSAIQSQASKYGISVEFLGVKKLEFPESVTQEVFNQMSTERQILANALMAEGENAARMIRSDAERRAAETVAAAQGQAQQIQGRAEAEAAKALSAFQQNPDLAIFLYRLNAVDALLKENAQIVMDTQFPGLDLFRISPTNSAAK